MSKHLKKPAFALALLLSVTSAYAEGEKPNEASVVATVNGVDITVGHMISASNRLPEQYRQLPAELLFKALLDQLVNQTLLKDSFKGDVPARVQHTLDNEQRTLLAAEAIELIVAEKVTEESMRAAYAAKFAEASPEKEYNAAHILVETEDEAKALIEELNGGADFGELAKSKSTGPSGPSGGSLGWFGKGMMVAPFEEAVIDLKDGAISEPVKTQFGWHVIKLMETRLAAAPAFEEVAGTLEQELSTQVVEAEIERLKKLGTVDTSPAEGFDPAILKDQSLLGE